MDSITNIENNTGTSVTLSEEEENMLAQALDIEHTEIPVNSRTLEIDETTSRFSSAIWYEKLQEQTITLAGVGGIGSYVGFLLSRMKPKRLIIYDPDTVETVNMSGQLYGINDIRYRKVTALANMIRQYSTYYNVTTFASTYNSSSDATDIMICGFDNMMARRVFFNNWLEHVKSKSTEEEKKNCLYIDGRLAAEEFQVLSIQGNDERAIKEYKDKWLFSDEEAEETICSYKQTTFMANMIASTIVNVFVNFVANMCNPIIDRAVPFFISYNAETMFTKTVM